jgi:cytochrome d ubiquinol oxidase subunit I
LLAYMAVYLFMYPSGVLLMWRAVRKGPAVADEADESDSTIEAGRPKAPVLAGAAAVGGHE